MAKMYYNLEEAMIKLSCTEDQIRGFVRAGKIREFRDAGKVNYRVDEVDQLATSSGDNVQLEDSGELVLSIEDSQEIPLTPGDSDTSESAPEDSGSAAGGSGSGAGLSDSGAAFDGSDAPIDLSGSGTISLEGSGSGELQLEDSGSAPAAAGSDSGADVLDLDEVDKNAVEEMKKDDTVITNIGISVFDDEDLEIAADPMAKTVLTSEDDSIALDGSGAGSGLLDLTRESDDTSLGAELLEGIDMGDSGEAVAPKESAEGEPLAAEAGLPESSMAPALGVGTMTVATVQPASPAFTGLLIAGTISLALVGAAAAATTMGAWPGYLNALAEQFWFFLAGTLVAGGLCAGIGFLVGRQGSGPRPAKPKKEKKAKKACAVSLGSPMRSARKPRRARRSPPSKRKRPPWKTSSRSASGPGGQEQSEQAGTSPVGPPPALL